MSTTPENEPDEPLTVEHWQPLREDLAELLGVDPDALRPQDTEDEK